MWVNCVSCRPVVEVEDRVVGDVRPELVDPQEVVGTQGGEHAGVHPPVAAAREKPDLRVEVRRHLGESETEAYALRLVPRVERVRVVVLPGLPGRVRSRDESR